MVLFRKFAHLSIHAVFQTGFCEFLNSSSNEDDGIMIIRKSTGIFKTFYSSFEWIRARKAHSHTANIFAVKDMQKYGVFFRVLAGSVT